MDHTEKTRTKYTLKIDAQQLEVTLITFLEEVDGHDMASVAQANQLREATSDHAALFLGQFLSVVQEGAILFTGNKQQRGGSSTLDFGFNIPALAPGKTNVGMFQTPTYYQKWPTGTRFAFVPLDSIVSPSLFTTSDH